MTMSSRRSLQVAGLFAGIGGFERGLEAAGHKTVLLCEVWDPARRVLKDHFPVDEMEADIVDLVGLPGDVDVVTAGFPCTDLSQAGQQAGIGGRHSGLVSQVFRLLRERAAAGKPVDWLVMENVPNMLRLDKGWAMGYLQQRFAQLGMLWAYRTVDSRAFGRPQRRRRVVLVASSIHDPRSILFADEAGVPPAETYESDAFGFYWTEGRTGLGWAQDAVPPLKGGSGWGIPSPPGIWLPGAATGQAIVMPSIEDAEELQGFPRGWTAAVEEGRSNGPRWKLVGNAVTVDVARWVGERLADPREPILDGFSRATDGWPAAAFGRGSRIWEVPASEFPLKGPYTHLRQVVDVAAARPVSHRGIAGFWRRLRKTTLGQYPGFREAVAAHEKATAS